jgi:tetratricopeptide (TPR) repeat protein
MRAASLRVLLLSLPLLGGLACQDDAAKVQEHLARGDKYMEEQRPAEAEIEFKSALQIDPNHADAHFKLAHAYLRNRKVRDGFWELRETVRLDANNHAAKLEFAQLAILAGEHEEALKQAELVVAAEPKNVSARLMQGQALDVLKRPDEALAAYRQAIEVGPDDPGALRALAHALGERGQLEEAESIWRRIVDVEKSHAAHSTYAGFLRRYFKLERLADAEAELRKGLEVATDAEKPVAYGQLATFLFNTGRGDESVALLQQAIESVDENVDLIYALARIQVARGDSAAADALVERATREKPDDPRVFLVLANYRARSGDRVGALQAAEQAVAIDPKRSESQLRKAEILVELGWRKEREGGVEEGAAIVADVLSREPANADALFVDAKIKITRNQMPEAIAAVRTALEARPDWAEARYVLGTALAAQKEYQTARTELARAVDLDPSLAEAIQVLAQVHHQLGEHEYAVEVGRRYLKLRPGDAKTRLLVAQSLVRLEKLDDAVAELQSLPTEQRNAEVDYALGRIALTRADQALRASRAEKISTGERNRLTSVVLEQRARAREQLLAADRAMPNQPDVLENLLDLARVEKAFALEREDAGLAAAADERLGEAMRHIEAAASASPQDAKLQQIVGVVRVMQNRLEDAEAAFRKSIELDASDREGYERLARFYAGTGQTQKTIEIYEKAIEVRPQDAGFQHYLGMLYELNGDRPRAIERYEEAVRLQPDLAEAKNNLAYIYADSGQNLDRALDLAQDAKALLPDNPSVADTLGWVLFKRGVPAAAITYLKEAEAKTRPEDASIGVVRHHLAQAYAAAGDTEQAIAALDRSLDAVEAQREAMRKADREPGPEPAWVSEARTQREQLVARRSAG